MLPCNLCFLRYKKVIVIPAPWSHIDPPQFRTLTRVAALTTATLPPKLMLVIPIISIGSINRTNSSSLSQEMVLVPLTAMY